MDLPEATQQLLSERLDIRVRSVDDIEKPHTSHAPSVLCEVLVLSLLIRLQDPQELCGGWEMQRAGVEVHR